MRRILSILILATVLTCVLAGCGSTVPSPEIEEGEFDFSVTYEYGGEVKTVSGVYVCKYSGTSWTLDGGYHRAWEGFITGDVSEDTIELGTAEDGGTVALILALYPDYFMGDFVEGDRNIPAPYISVTITEGEDMTIIHEPGEVEEYCGAKIIGYEYAEPIENSFG